MLFFFLYILHFPEHAIAINVALLRLQEMKEMGGELESSEKSAMVKG